jgi:hypothetical protein
VELKIWSEPQILTKDNEAKAMTLLNKKDFKGSIAIESAVFVAKTAVDFSICRHVTSLLSLKMKTCRVGPDQGGRPAQLATLEDSVLYSERLLSLDDINMAVACSTSIGTAMRFRWCRKQRRYGSSTCYAKHDTIIMLESSHS